MLKPRATAEKKGEGLLVARYLLAWDSPPLSMWGWARGEGLGAVQDAVGPTDRWRECEWAQYGQICGNLAYFKAWNSRKAWNEREDKREIAGNKASADVGKGESSHPTCALSITRAFMEKKLSAHLVMKVITLVPILLPQGVRFSHLQSYPRATSGSNQIPSLTPSKPALPRCRYSTSIQIMLTGVLWINCHLYWITIQQNKEHVAY